MSELSVHLSGDVARVDDMLSHYVDVLDVTYGGAFGEGTGNPVRLPEVWRKSGYPILERLLHALKLGAADAPSSLYSHVRGWYFDGQRIRVPAYVWRLDGRGRPVIGADGNPQPRKHSDGRPMRRVIGGVEQWEILVRREPWVSERQVRRAVDWLASSWPSNARYRPERVVEIAARLERGRRVAA